MADIFISYAREDETRVQHLAHCLEEQGWSVFWDRRIPAGQTWRSYIGHALSEASCVIVAWTHHSIASRWVIEEADEGLQRGILVPVLFEAVKPPLGFGPIQAADLTDWHPGSFSPRFEQFIQDIKAVLGATPTTPRGGQKPGPPRSSWSRLPGKLKVLFACLLVGTLVLVGRIGYLGYRRYVADFAKPGDVSTRPVNREGPPSDPNPKQDEVPAFFLGKWGGEVQGPLMRYRIALTLSPAEYSMMSFADLGNCSSTLKLINKSDASIIFREHVTEGPCTGDRVELSKINDSSLSFVSQVSFVLVRGTLHKIE